MVVDEPVAAIVRRPVDPARALLAEFIEGEMDLGGEAVARVVEHVPIDHPGRIDMRGDLADQRVVRLHHFLPPLTRSFRLLLRRFGGVRQASCRWTGGPALRMIVSTTDES